MSSVPNAPASPRLFTAPVIAALATVYVVWGSTYFAMRVALASFPPFFQGGLRFLTAGVLLFAFQRARGAPWPTLREWRDGGIVGVLLLVFGNGGVVYAEQYVSSSVAAIFIGASPLAAALWTGCFGIWPRPIQWVGIMAGFVGVVLLAGGAQLVASPAGVIALTVAEVCWTFGSVLAQQRLKLAPGPIGFATQMLAGGAVMMIVAAARGEVPVFVAGWPPTTAASLAFVYLIGAGALGAFSAYMYLLSHVPSTIAISYAYVNPLIAVLIGVAFGGETLTSREGWATAIIVGSVVLLTQERAPAKRAPDA